VNATLFAERLGATGRDYAVTLTVANSSKTWGQLVWGARTKIIYFQPGDDKSYQALFFSTLPSQPAMEVPPLQSRQLQFLATFPDDGVYVLEVDLCRQFGGNCLVQKYISVGKGG
jgi:hypothetical protein